MTRPAIYDNSMLDKARRCMRLYYFTHVRHWREEEFLLKPAFGSAWAEAAVAIWQGRKAEAFDAFMARWLAEGGPRHILPAQSRYYGAFTPDTARLLITAYARANDRLVGRGKVLGTEVGFELLLRRQAPDGTGAINNQTVRYGGLLDMLVEQQELLAIEFKATGWATSRGGFVEAWLQAWRSSAQVAGYVTALDRLAKRPVKLFLDATLVHKTSRKFELIRQTRKPWQVVAWEDGVVKLVQQLVQEYEALEHQADAPVLTAFPRNDTQCTAFNRLCPYYAVCHGAANPEQVDTPPGFVERQWDFKGRAQAALDKLG